jgi:hypothetical protein
VQPDETLDADDQEMKIIVIIVLEVAQDFRSTCTLREII